MTGRIYATMYERLLANSKQVDPENPQSCWLWTGPTRRHYGAVSFRVPGGGKKTTPFNKAAHRVMLEEVWDVLFPFDEGGHLCGEPLCIHPDHLEVQTQALNLSDRKGYAASAGCLIPVLFPRAGSFGHDSDEDWATPGGDTGPCPF